MEPLTLHAVHESLGATFGEAQGREVVSRYGELRDEHAAARLNACLFDFSFHETLRLTGEDRIGFLHGMVTNDVKGMAEGEAAYAAMVTAKGALVADMRILRRRGDLLLDLEPGAAPLVQQFLGKYLVSEEVEISDASADFALLRLVGPEVHRIAAAAFGHETPLPSRDHFVQIDLDAHPAWLIGIETMRDLAGDGIVTSSMTSFARVVALAAMLCSAAASAQSDSADAGTSGVDESVNPHSVDNRNRKPAGAASPEEQRSLEEGEEGSPASVLNRDAPKPKRITNDELDRAEVGNPDVDSARE